MRKKKEGMLGISPSFCYWCFKRGSIFRIITSKIPGLTMERKQRNGMLMNTPGENTDAERGPAKITTFALIPSDILTTNTVFMCDSSLCFPYYYMKDVVK